MQRSYMYMYVIFVLLELFCTVDRAVAVGAFYEERILQCPEHVNTIEIPNRSSSIRSLTLLSPCYRNVYDSGCSCQTACTAVMDNVPDGLWMGLYIDGGLGTSHFKGNLTLTIGVQNETVNVDLPKQLPGLFYNHMHERQFQIGLFDFTQPHVELFRHKFKIDVKFAYVIGRSYAAMGTTAPAGSGGFIVSHENFNDGRESANNYLDDTNKDLTLTALSNKFVLRLSFLSFHLQWSLISFWYGPCEDALQITGVEGHPSGLQYCGIDDILNHYIDLYPIGGNVTFQFITRKNTFEKVTTSTGFLIKYEVLDPETRCPPSIPNTKPLVEALQNTEVYNIECKTDYWTTSHARNQTVNCSRSNLRLSVQPCILIECELPEISTDSELNFTLSSRGRATVGTNISYSCNSKRYELTDGTKISTCTSRGEWNSSIPRCSLIEIECELPTISNSSKLNFTLSSSGKITAGKSITYSCDEENETLTGASDISYCTSGGEWSSSVPNCTVKVAARNRPYEGITVIASCVGALVIIAVVLCITCYLKYKQRGTSGSEVQTDAAGNTIPLINVETATPTNGEDPYTDEEGYGIVREADMIDISGREPRKCLTWSPNNDTEVYEHALPYTDLTATVTSSTLHPTTRSLSSGYVLDAQSAESLADNTVKMDKFSR